MSDQEDKKYNPQIQRELRIFTRIQKEECWSQAQDMPGRHSDRWKLDAVGNPVMKHLTNCRGPLCYNYDHIIPHSKGGKTELFNCQLLQTFVNLYKSNKLDLPHSELKRISPQEQFTHDQYDAIEKAIYNTVLIPGKPKIS